MKKKTGFVKVGYSLPEELVKRIVAVTEHRKKQTGLEYGVQTGVVKQALDLGLKELEKQLKKPLGSRSRSRLKKKPKPADTK